MVPDFEKLTKILVSEREGGCLDRVVIGGLDKFLAAWLREARAAAGPASQRSAIDQVAASLQGYARKPVDERVTAVEMAIEVLHTVRQDRPEPHVQQQRPQIKTPQTKQKPTEKPAADPQAPVQTLRGVGTAQARRLERLGVRTVQDLLYLFPRRYDDFSRLKTITQLQYGDEVTIIGVVQEARNQKTRRGVEITRAAISDGTGTVEAVWFNQPYLLRHLQRGRRIVLSGQVDQYLGRLTFQAPQWEPWRGEFVHTGRLVPVYPLTEGLSARRVRTLVKSAIERLSPHVIDPLPTSLVQKYDLMDLPSALQQVHFPDDEDSLARARHRLGFGELLLIQLGVLRQRYTWQQQPGHPMEVDQTLLDAFVQGLPFALTGAQKRAMRELADDLRKPQPMSRLLQGDVGSGKTVVALAAMMLAVANDLQAVIMAPTEILAEQHHRTLTELMRGVEERPREQEAAAAQAAGIAQTRVGLLTGSLSQAEKEEQRRQIATGELDIIVGTHALIQEGVDFKDLGLAIVDEQHRFGVTQRAALRQKGYNPHMLVMSATPIPRSLALTLYGDLDLSIIDELPPGRQKVITKWLAPLERERAYVFLRGQVEQGRQGFIICPLIEESDKIEAKAAVSEYKRLQEGVFPDMRLALLHGRMSSTDKEDVMKRFRMGEYEILVSTPVVEVGIDVPNATVMLVEGADRFGLAQLHQFRGRVGRGQYQSYCLLLAESASSEAERRLKTLESTQDGFVLAEEDLKMRGPGEFFGTRQSGLPDLRVARLGDVRVLEQARRAAQGLFQDDPTLSQPEHQLLAQRVREFWGSRTDLS
jgi:ATP-dependent DNA helicase RecG